MDAVVPSGTCCCVEFVPPVGYWQLPLRGISPGLHPQKYLAGIFFALLLLKLSRFLDLVFFPPD